MDSSLPAKRKWNPYQVKVVKYKETETAKGKYKKRKEASRSEQIQYFVKLLQGEDGIRGKLDLQEFFSQGFESDTMCHIHDEYHSALNCAFDQKNYGLAEFMIQIGAEVSEQLVETPELNKGCGSVDLLFLAVRQQDNQMLDLLVKYNVDLRRSYESERGRNRIERSYSDDGYVDSDEGYGSDDSSTSYLPRGSYDILDIAIHCRNVYAIQLLLSKGVDPIQKIEESEQHLIPYSWNDYFNLSEINLRKYATLDVFILCLKKNYKFSSYIVAEAPKFQNAIVVYCLKQLAQDRFKQEIESAVKTSFSKLLASFNHRMTKREIRQAGMLHHESYQLMKTQFKQCYDDNGKDEDLSADDYP